MIRESQLGDFSYVMFDLVLGFKGRIPLGPVRILAGVGFGMRLLAVTRKSDLHADEPDPGFGIAGTAGVEIPVWDLLSIIVQADARYMREPENAQFRFSSMFAAGVGIRF